MEKARNCSKGEKLLLKSNFSSYPQYFYLLLSFYVRTGTRISLRDKRLFEITEVEIARVDCIRREIRKTMFELSSILLLPGALLYEIKEPHVAKLCEKYFFSVRLLPLSIIKLLFC